MPHSVSKEFCTGTLTAHPTGYSSPHAHFLVLESEMQILSQSLVVGSGLSGMVIGPLYRLLEIVANLSSCLLLDWDGG